jgi:DNA-directed RNA polymerase subunit H (RpoH/RPB5)
LFDVPESATKVEIIHTYVIKDIFIPKGCENDPVLARQKAVRKGEIKRVVSVDGKIKQSTIKLEA